MTVIQLNFFCWLLILRCFYLKFCNNNLWIEEWDITWLKTVGSYWIQSSTQRMKPINSTSRQQTFRLRTLDGRLIDNVPVVQTASADTFEDSSLFTSYYPGQVSPSDSSPGSDPGSCDSRVRCCRAGFGTTSNANSTDLTSGLWHRLLSHPLWV